MFLDDRDRDVFLELLKRYLSEIDRPDERGRRFPCLRDKVRLITFALMTTHFHLILFQIEPGGLDDLMHRVLTAYVKYFNNRHGTQGPMFNGEYRADHKPDRRSQLTAIAYVHDNHGADCHCNHCGHRYFIADSVDTPSWIGARGALDLFGSRSSYRRYRQARGALSEIAT